MPLTRDYLIDDFAPDKSFSKMFAPIISTLGGLQAGLGSYFTAKAQKSALEYRARMAERSAQSTLQAGQQAVGNLTSRAGKIRSSQKAGQGARGIAIGYGSGGEELATTDLMKEIDAWTISANAERQAVNARSQGLMDQASANSISPGMSMMTSLLTSATQIAPSWYSLVKRNAMSRMED